MLKEFINYQGEEKYFIEGKIAKIPNKRMELCRKFEKNTSAKGTGISADTDFENKFQYRKHWKRG